MRTRAQVRCNRGVWVRVRASILAQAQVRTTGRARAGVRVGACRWGQMLMSHNLTGVNVAQFQTTPPACVRASMRR